MKLAKLAAAAAALCLAAAPAGAEITARPIAIDDFARVPNIQSVSLSAEGDAIVAIIAAPGSNNSDTALATWDMNNLAAGPVVTPSGNRMRFIAATALKAGRVLVLGRQEWTGALGGCGEGRTTGSERTFVTKAYLTDMRHSEFDEAFAAGGRALGVSENTQRCFEIAGTASLAANLPLDPDHVIVQQLNQQTLRGDYYRYNLRTNETELLFREAGTSVALLNPRNGEVLVREEVIPGGTTEIRTEIRNPQSGAFEVHPVLTRNLGERYTQTFEGIDEATGNYYVITDRFSDKAAVYSYDPRARQFSAEPLLAHPEFNIVGLVLGSNRNNFNQLLGFTYAGADYSTFWLDAEMRSIQDGLNASFRDRHVAIIDFNEDKSTILFETSSGAHPPSYYLLRNRREAVLLGHSRPWLNATAMTEPQLVHYPARDGLQIPGILTTPAGWTRADGPLPTIILPHGGPWARDTAGWDESGWPQFLASRGYAVLQPQYRGSEGWGRALWLAGDAEWGQKMQDDKDDGAAWLVSQGIAAQDRIAMFGYSYGGFAAIAATVRPNSPYQCAIAGAGVANLTRIGNNWSQNRLQRLYQGRTVDGMDPMEHTDQANIPILLIHGDRDVRVPIFHSQDFYNAVRSRVPAQLVVIEDMPHSLPWYPQHYRTMLSSIENYLARDCGPGGL
jgi:fermentation-respiration switch protein FrsA (DUF1100 family)